MKPTKEQAAIVAAFTSGMDLVVEAGAGTGKTTTLKLLANSGYAKKKKGLYLAFNKKIATEASETFNSNVTCRTAHSLAFGFFSSRVGRGKFPGMGDKIRSDDTNLAKGFDEDRWYEALFEADYPLQEMPEPEGVVNVAETGHPNLTAEISMKDYYGSRIQVNVWDILLMIDETVRNYSLSGDFKIGPEHVSAYSASNGILRKINSLAFRRLLVARHLFNIEQIQTGLQKISFHIQQTFSSSMEYDKVCDDIIKSYIPNEDAYEMWKANDKSNDKELALLFRYLTHLRKRETHVNSVAGKHVAANPLDLSSIKDLQERQQQLAESFVTLCVKADMSFVLGTIRSNRSLATIYEGAGMKFYSPKHQPELISSWEFSFNLLSHYIKDDETGGVMRLYDFVLREARNAWEEIKDAESPISINFDHILKMWQESKPNLAYDFIFFDEAQDANPVMAELILSQTKGRSTSQVIVVGDENQSIYDFRGASGAMKMFKRYAVESEDSAFAIKQLTECFRFGPEIAQAANNILNHTGSSLRLVGAAPWDSEVNGFPKIDWERTNAIICRQNAEILEAGIEALTYGRIPIINISVREMKVIFEDLLAFLRASENNEEYVPNEGSQFYGCTNYPEAWQQFQDSSELHLERSVARNTSGRDQDGRLSENGLLTVLSRLAELERSRNAHDHPMKIEIVSAHQSKGMEWDHVVMWRNFSPSLQSSNCPFERNDKGYPLVGDDGKYVVSGDIVDQEYNINYVALTRAKKSVSIPMFTDNFDLAILAQFGIPWDQTKFTESPAPEININARGDSTPEKVAESIGVEAADRLFESGALPQLVLVGFSEAEEQFFAGPSLAYMPEPGTTEVYVRRQQKLTMKATIAAMNAAYQNGKLRAVPLYLTTERAFELKGKRYFLAGSRLLFNANASNSNLEIRRQITFMDRTLRKIHEFSTTTKASGEATDQEMENGMIEMMAFLSQPPAWDTEQIEPFAQEYMKPALEAEPDLTLELDRLTELNEGFQRSAEVYLSNQPGFPIQSFLDDDAQRVHVSVNLPRPVDAAISLTPSKTDVILAEPDRRCGPTFFEDLLAAYSVQSDAYRFRTLRQTVAAQSSPHGFGFRVDKSDGKTMKLMAMPTTQEMEWREAFKAYNESPSLNTHPGPPPQPPVLFSMDIPEGNIEGREAQVILKALAPYMTGVRASEPESVTMTE